MGIVVILKYCLPTKWDSLLPGILAEGTKTGFKHVCLLFRCISLFSFKIKRAVVEISMLFFPCVAFGREIIGRPSYNIIQMDNLTNDWRRSVYGWENCLSERLYLLCFRRNRTTFINTVRNLTNTKPKTFQNHNLSPTELNRNFSAMTHLIAMTHFLGFFCS